MSDYGFGGILADDMGLGKTLQMITVLEDAKKNHKASIVITPATLILNWQDEIKNSQTISMSYVLVEHYPFVKR